MVEDFLINFQRKLISSVHSLAFPSFVFNYTFKVLPRIYVDSSQSKLLMLTLLIWVTLGKFLSEFNLPIVK